MTDEIGQLLG